MVLESDDRRFLSGHRHAQRISTADSRRRHRRGPDDRLVMHGGKRRTGKPGLRWPKPNKRRPRCEGFTINGRAVSVNVEVDAPLLWVIRDDLGLTGTKFGCGIGMCGVCTIHVGGKATRSCITPISATDGAEVDDRWTGSRWRASCAEGMAGAAGAAMRLLPVRSDHARRGSA